MDAQRAKRVIRDQEAEMEAKLKSEKIVEREFLPNIGEALPSPNALVLKGVRRCGKSIASVLFAKKGSFGYVNFDDPSFSGMSTADLAAIVEAVYSLKGDVETVVLDEPQNVRGWELLVSRLRETKKVIVTGSNASLLSREFSTRLTGRHVSLTAFPFSFREYLEFEGVRPDLYLTKGVAETKNALERYIIEGGFPEARKFGTRFLLQVYEDIVTKDVERRHGIRYRETFREFANYVVSNSANELTFNKLKNVFGLKSVHTAKNYVGYLEDAYLTFSLQRYHPKLKVRMMAPRKSYCIDVGIVRQVGGGGTDGRGRALEGIVAVELQRRRSFWLPGVELNYWKDHQQDEVDFVLRRGGRTLSLVQASYDPTDEATLKREMRSILKASKELSCRDLTVVTWDYEGTERAGGRAVTFVPLWKWLLPATPEGYAGPDAVEPRKAGRDGTAGGSPGGSLPPSP